MTPTLKDVVRRARSQVGGYFPGKSPYGVWYDEAYGGGKNVYDAAQFCAMGLSWVFAHEGGKGIFPMHAYTPSGMAAWKQKGRWHEGTKGIQPGDVLYFDFPGDPKRVSHVGLALSSWKSGVDTIEFNTSGTARGDQRNGRTVARKRRTSSIVGYGRPAYAAAAAPKPTATGKGSKKPVILKPMHEGSKDGHVGLWQRVLLEMGYSGVGHADDSFGPRTVQATRNFQAARGLTVDGSAGPVTVSAALLSDGDHVLSLGDHGARVGLLQVIVGAKVDNSFGPSTQAETREVQRYFEMDPDGVADSSFVRHYRKAAS